jgi:hypothetical protein
MAITAIDVHGTLHVKSAGEHPAVSTRSVDGQGTVTTKVTTVFAASLTVIVEVPAATAVTLKVSPVNADTVATAGFALVTSYVGAGLNLTPPLTVIERD